MFTSNLRFKYQIFIQLSYMLIVTILVSVHKYRFQSKRLHNRGESHESKYKVQRNLFKSYLVLLKYCTSHVKQESIIYLILIRHSITSIFALAIGSTWFCEKLCINIRLPKQDILFENSKLILSSKHQYKNLNKQKLNKGTFLFIYFARSKISPEYGNKIISKMAIKKEIQQKADEWVYSNLQGDFISVHYRGTDVFVKSKYRHMTIKDYIAYLKGTLGDHCNIFACSDQAQFIEQMQVAFPGRVFSRDITRSRDNTPLHRGRDSVHKGEQQKEDALIDLLVLSKASLVYTTGSYFADVARFLNPSIKIISLDGREVYYKGIPNYLPSPKL